MILHKGQLMMLRETKMTCVYGNDVFPAVYVPKRLILQMGLEQPPDSIVLRVSTKTDDAENGEDHGQVPAARGGKKRKRSGNVTE